MKPLLRSRLPVETQWGFFSSLEKALKSSLAHPTPMVDTERENLVEPQAAASKMCLGKQAICGKIYR